MRTMTTLAGLAALAGAALVLAAGSAQTARTDVPATVAGYHKIVVSGGTLPSITHTLGGDSATITASDLYFSGNLKNRTVRVRFGATVAVTCQYLSTVKGMSHFTCAGLNQRTDTSSVLTIEVS